MASEVPFERGGRSLPVRSGQTATGGRRNPGCHEPREYNRRRTAPVPAPAGNSSGEERYSMRRDSPRTILFVSVLLVLVACCGSGFAEAAIQKVAANALAIERALQQVEPPGEKVPAPRRRAQTAKQKVEKPTESIPRGGCVTGECHSDVKAMPFIHGPVGVDACDACHKETDPSRHAFEMQRTGADLCGFCHELELKGEYVHKPAAEGQCTQCHNAHGGENRFMLRGGVGAASCAECHDDVAEDMPVVHGPVAAGACTACHRAHSSDHAKLLILPERDLCLKCHLALKERLETVGTVHQPVAAGCTACHLPHAADEKMLLNAETTELCLDCHSQIEELIEDATTEHSAVSTGPACRNCHDPHGSDHSAMLINDMIEVCLSCHDREIELADGTELVNMRAVLAPGKNLHGPIAQRNCAPCHEVHGGANFRLLTEEYPLEFYAPFREESYALCFACHEPELVLDARTDELTDFRNGDHNLHHLHVNKETKGRTCRACHEIHASNKAKHVRDWVPFGSKRWRLPINFEQTETGGRCGPGCHRAYGYDRVKPVINHPAQRPATRPEATTAPRGEGKDEKKGSQS